MTVKIYKGNCLDTLREFSDNTFQSCVTSPPYFGLRDYGEEGQIGLEDNPQDYIDSIVSVFREVRRVLRNDGTLWLNIGDSYAAGKIGRDDTGSAGLFQGPNMKFKQRKPPLGYKPKDLLMIPAQVAMALRQDGWYLRSEIIWHKLNVMPEPVKDRPTNAVEKIYLLTKSEKYYYDQDAVREPNTSKNGKNPLGKNLRNVWSVTNHDQTKAYGEHLATFPQSILEPCLSAGGGLGGSCSVCGTPLVGKFEEKNVSHSDDIFEWNGVELIEEWVRNCEHNEADIVKSKILDPFFGSGSTAITASILNLDTVGCEISEEYINVSVKRLHDNDIHDVSIFDLKNELTW